jgi:hypothetical protein
MQEVFFIKILSLKLNRYLINQMSSDYLSNNSEEDMPRELEIKTEKICLIIL